MAKVFGVALTDARAYAGRYLSYVRATECFVMGGLVPLFDLDAIPVKEAMEPFHDGYLPDGRGVRNAGRNEPDSQGRIPRRFMDLQLTLEKCLSVLMVVLTKEEARELVRTAVKKAIVTAFIAFEERFIVARAGSDCARHFVAAKSFVPVFFEDAARPVAGKTFGDPHLHAHGLLAATGLCSDGKVRALDTRVVFQNLPHLSRAITAEIVANLNRSGFRCGLDDNGRIEIPGVPKALCEFFSSRTREFNAYIDEHGLDKKSMRDRDQAVKFSRSEKESSASRSEHFAYWRDRAERDGFDLKAIEADILSRAPKPEIPKEERKESVLANLSGVLDDLTASGIADPHLHDLEESLMETAGRQESRIHLVDIFEAARSGARSIGAAIDGIRDWRVNRQLDARLDHFMTTEGPSILQPRIERIATNRELSENERNALEGLTRSGPQLRVLDMPSAVQRASVLAATAEAMKSAGIDCIAIAQSKKASAELEACCKVPSFNAAAANRQWDKTEWGFGKVPSANPFKRVTTDKFTDALGYYSGVITKQEYEAREFHRWRSPLALAGRPHAVLIDAQGMKKSVLNELLGHIKTQSKNVTVILAGSAEDRPRSIFARVVQDHGAYPMPASPFEYDAKRREPFRIEPNPWMEQPR